MNSIMEVRIMRGRTKAAIIIVPIAAFLVMTNQFANGQLSTIGSIATLEDILNPINSGTNETDPILRYSPDPTDPALALPTDPTFEPMSPEEIMQSLDESIIELKNEGDALKAEIANTDLAGTGLVESLIMKVAYYEGQISVMGGGTWAYLHDVQDALLAKIKATGESGFTIPEQALIQSFASNAEQSKLEHPSSNVFG